MATILKNTPIDDITRVIDVLAQARDEGKQIFLMGNGGSGATASHFVNDLVKGTIQEDKPRFRAIALTDNMPIILAIANDWSYDRIFVEQLASLGQPGDVAVGFSGSGNSENVLLAMAWARENGLTTVGFTGLTGGKLKDMVDICVQVPTDDMGQIESVHLTLIHPIYIALAER